MTLKKPCAAIRAGPNGPGGPRRPALPLVRNLHVLSRDEESLRHVLMALEEAPRFGEAHRLLLELDAARQPSNRSAPENPPEEAEAKQ